MANTTGISMRVIHRYLGFFLGGIFTMYALSGISLIFRDTDFLKKERIVEKQIEPNAQKEDLGRLLDIRRLSVEKEEGDIMYFSNGTYDKFSGNAKYSVMELPLLIDKMQHLHKAQTKDPLYFLNIFFGLSLMFFVISSFWMFTPKMKIFKKGLYFSVAGIILVLVLLFV